MLRKIIDSLLNNKQRHYSSSDYNKPQRGSYQRYSSSDYGKSNKEHAKYGHKHYKRKHKSGSFFSS